MTDKKAAVGTNDFMTAYKAFIFDLPMAGTRWGLGLGGEKEATEAAWTGYDAIVRLSSTAIESLYRMPWFGTFTSRSLEGWLRWQQVSKAFTRIVLTGLVQAAGLPTAAEVQALREELRAQTIDLPIKPREREALTKVETLGQKAPTLTQKSSVTISNVAA